MKTSTHLRPLDHLARTQEGDSFIRSDNGRGLGAPKTTSSRARAGDFLSWALFLTLIVSFIFNLSACDDKASGEDECETGCPWMTTCEDRTCQYVDEVDPSLVNRYPSLAIGEQNQLYIAAQVSTTQDLVVGIWHPEEERFYFSLVDEEGEVGAFAALALYPDGRPGVAYLDEGEQHLKYAYLDSDGVWQTSRDGIDITSAVGYESSLAIDESGTPHIVYRDASYNTLRYAYFYEDLWKLEIVDSGSDFIDQIPEAERCPEPQRDIVGLGVGFDTSLVIQGTTPVVTYYDADCGSLRLGRRSQTGWSLQVIDGWSREDYVAPSPEPRTSVGRFSSIAINPLGDLALAYYDGTLGSLKFSREGTIENVDRGLRDAIPPEKHVVGQIPKLAYSKDWVIAHLDATSRKVILSERVDDSWRSIVIPGLEGGFGLDLVIGPDGTQYILSLLREPGITSPIQMVVQRPAGE